MNEETFIPGETTVYNGETEVQVTTVGEVTGSDEKGEPKVQNFTEASLQRIAETHDDVLVDIDHESEREGKTAAAGWLSKLHLVPGVGLFGKIRWTDIGKRLIDNRVFRFLSPSFLIDEKTREPLAMTSVALTNRPAQKGQIKPIVNSEAKEDALPKEGSEANENDIKELSDMEIEKIREDLKEEVMNAVRELIEDLKEAKEATEAEEVKAEEPKEEAKEEAKEEEVKSEEAVEAPKEEKSMSEEPKEEEKKEEEVIKIETLNSAPKPTLAPKAEKWRGMTPSEFCKWVDGGMR